MKCYKKALQFYNNIPTNQVFCKTPGYGDEDGDDDDDDDDDNVDDDDDD